MRKDSDTPVHATPDSAMVNPIEKPKTRRRLGLFLIFLIIVIAILVSAIYILITKQQSQNTYNNQQQMEAALATLAKQQRTLGDNLENTTELIQSKQMEQQEQLNALIKHVESTNTIDATVKTPWLLRKARYYLELAQINSQWSNNTEASIALLQEADGVLQKIPDESVYSVRQKIAQETDLLKSIPPVDIASLMEKLDKAQACVVQLPLKQLTPSATTQATRSSWRDHWQASLNFLEKLVIVRQHKPGEAPILTPLYQTVLRERISMDLQEAQWAVLQNNPQIYQQSLARIIASIQHHESIKNHFAKKDGDDNINYGNTNYGNTNYDNTNYDNTNPEISAFLKQIQQLQQVQFMPAKPEISQSLNELNEIINSRSNNKIITIPKSNTSSPHQGNHLP